VFIVLWRTLLHPSVRKVWKSLKFIRGFQHNLETLPVKVFSHSKVNIIQGWLPLHKGRLSTAVSDVTVMWINELILSNGIRVETIASVLVVLTLYSIIPGNYLNQCPNNGHQSKFKSHWF